jgi:hypothetical protein
MYKFIQTLSLWWRGNSERYKEVFIQGPLGVGEVALVRFRYIKIGAHFLDIQVLIIPPYHKQNIFRLKIAQAMDGGDEYKCRMKDTASVSHLANPSCHVVICSNSTVMLLSTTKLSTETT